MTPKSASFVDGGVSSNLPVDVFHSRSSKGPVCPTFAVQLGADRELQKTDTLSNYTVSIANSMRHIADFDFILHNPDYKQLITVINIEGGEIAALNFALSKADKLKMMKTGAKSAADFLRSFNWTRYKATRKQVDAPYLAASVAAALNISNSS